MRRLIPVCTLLVLAALAAPTSSFADGGKSIATATPITVGQQEFGTTATGGRIAPGECVQEPTGLFASFWTLGVTAGAMSSRTHKPRSFAGSLRVTRTR